MGLLFSLAARPDWHFLFLQFNAILFRQRWAEFPGKERERLADYLERHRFVSGAAQLLRRYFDHHVARDSAALTYYLLFAIFPMLIFLNNLVGMLAFDIEGLLTQLARVIPRDVIDLLEQYLLYVSRVSNRTLMWFSLVFSIYFPYRAANALFLSVRKAYGAGMPTHFLRFQLRVLIYTLLLIVTLVLSLVVAVVGNRVLDFVSGYVYLSDTAIRVWTSFRFVLLGAVLFGIIALLYALALDERNVRRGILPGVLASLAVWIALSLLFSLYVERASRYSLIYGSIGGVIVVLLWLYLTASSLIMGAEFNSVLLRIPPGQAD
ncbi:MAG: YihY/virulence factor BrkB family protein [Ruminococcaceae bacterium]|nr:YihY/virulence factor BrkB family protein [Oscillospiraceae bacterium]